MKETKIKGLKIIFDDDYIQIFDAFQINNKEKMECIITEIKQKMDFCFINRDMKSITREWAGRNRLYRLKFCKNKMKDFKITNEEKVFKRILFYLIGFQQTKFVEKMKNIIKKIAIHIQEERYMRYVQKHRIRMADAYKEMLSCPEVTNLGNEVLIMLKQRVVFHDITKFEAEEFDAYRKHFFPISKKEKENNLENFEKAWQHHYDNNSHHWQHRRNNTEFNKNDPEQVVNILENVCDWLAVGYLYKNRPYQYYEKHKEKIELCPEEKEFFEYIIYSVDKKYIMMEIGAVDHE
jgi:hypothetical protein